MTHTTKKPNLIIIAEPEDILATSFARYAKNHGISVIKRSWIDAARLFTLTCVSGQVQVTPVVPIFLRPFLSRAKQLSKNTQAIEFEIEEARSVVLSAALACNGCVINDPRNITEDWFFFGLSSFHLDSFLGFTLRAEVFSSTATVAKMATTAPLWLRETSSGTNLPDSDEGFVFRTSKRPIWGRKKINYQNIIRIIVVGQWTKFIDKNDTSGEELGHLARRVCQSMGIKFGILTWISCPDPGGYTLIKIDQFPQIDDLCGYWEKVAAELLSLVAL